MGLRFGLINLFVFITIFAILLEDYQVECRGGGRGGGRGGSRGYRYRGGGGSSGSGGGGGGAWWIYLAVFGGIIAFVLGIFGVIYVCKNCR